MSSRHSLISRLPAQPRRTPSMSSSKKACPFCGPPQEQILAECAEAMALWDSYPVSPGHALIVPRRHVASLFDATATEREAILGLADEARRVVSERILAGRLQSRHQRRSCGGAVGTSPTPAPHSTVSRRRSRSRAAAFAGSSRTARSTGPGADADSGQSACFARRHPLCRKSTQALTRQVELVMQPLPQRDERRPVAQVRRIHEMVRVRLLVGDRHR